METQGAARHGISSGLDELAFELKKRAWAGSEHEEAERYRGDLAEAVREGEIEMKGGEGNGE